MERTLRSAWGSRKGDLYVWHLFKMMQIARYADDERSAGWLHDFFMLAKKTLLMILICKDQDRGKNGVAWSVFKEKKKWVGGKEFHLILLNSFFTFWSIISEKTSPRKLIFSFNAKKHISFKKFVTFFLLFYLFHFPQQ